MTFGCVICAEVFLNTDVGNKYPVCIKNCGHAFHQACLSTWLEKSKTCPVCRTPTSDSVTDVFRLHLMACGIDGSLSITISNKDVEDLRKEFKDIQDKVNTSLNSCFTKIKDVHKLVSNIKIELEKKVLSNGPPAQVVNEVAKPPPVVVSRVTRSKTAAKACGTINQQATSRRKQ